MTKRTLSKREAELILWMEWEGLLIISLEEIATKMHCSSGYARKMAHILHQKGWLDPLVRGQYLLVKADRGPEGIPSMNSYLVARFLQKPYFFGYRFACSHHGLLTQLPSVIHVAVLRHKQPIELKNIRFEFVVLTKKRLFGFAEETQFGEKIYISDLERTVIDALNRPDLVGGIESVVQVIFHSWKKLDYDKLIDYLVRFQDRALARRFGYLIELLDLSFRDDLMEYFQSQVTKNPIYLGSCKRWGKAGERDKRWNLILNIPYEALMGELDIL